MGFEEVNAYLVQAGYGDRVQEFDVSSATVELAAQALGCPPAHIAKTLSFLNGERTILLVTAGDARVDSSRFKKTFGVKKVKMVPAEEVEARTGHAVGGVCPFGVPDSADVFLDESLRRFDTVFPACGSDNSSIELSPADLETCSCSRGWVDVCSGWR